MLPSTRSKWLFPEIEYASGQWVTTRAGDDYLDFTGSNLTVVLGYRPIEYKGAPNFPGISYLERELIEHLRDLTGYNYFRFFKNGHDAVDCARRLSQHLLEKKCVTGYCGYHGTSDSYMSTTKDHQGIDPQPSIKVPEDGDCDILIYEPRFKDKVKDVKCGLKIVDTLKEGIRALYNEYDDDLVLYGKSIANGTAISVLTGKDEYMGRLDEIYYSTSYGSENVGLFETINTIEDYRESKTWHDELWKYAEKLPPWRDFTEQEVKHFMDRGIFNNGYYQIMVCHNPEDIDRLARAYADMR